MVCTFPKEQSVGSHTQLIVLCLMQAPPQRAWLSAVTTDAKIYVFGGHNNLLPGGEEDEDQDDDVATRGETLDTVQSFEAQTNTWTQLEQTLYEARAGHANLTPNLF